MVTNNHYDDEALAKLLHNRMGTNERDVLAHVESCVTCQSQLESLSRGGLTWDEVTDLLTPSEELPTSFKGENAAMLDPSTASAASFLEASEYPNSLGRFDRYEIMEVLGRGGMGIVLRGYDTSLNRHSAVKVLAPELASNAAARKRFSREARSAAAVVHPHVVPIQTVDEHAGIPYLVMPVVEGKSVEVRVRDSGPMQVIEAVRIGAQVADGLAAAHSQGLVHRDIKPANVLLENGVERVLITDFGLARAIDDASMTRSGVVTGTPQYMSPEQAHGDAIDHRSDLFSLGSLLYFMLSGHSPFRAETTMGVLNRIGNDRPRSLRSINAEVPEWLEQIVTKLLEKRSDLRFQTAGEVARLLDRWLAHLQQPELNPPPQSGSSPIAGTRKLKRLAVAAAAIGVFYISWSLWQPNQDPGSKRSTEPVATSEAAEKAKPTTANEEANAATLAGLHAGQKVLWRIPLGSQTTRAPVVDDDHIYIGSNNGHAYLERFPSSFDLGVLLCFRKSDGKFLWQHSNHKLPTGRVHDWPQSGITSRPCVSGERVFYVTNRAEIVCLDTEGFRDSQNDGAFQAEVHAGPHEADIIWRLDMMKELGVQPHNVSTCTVALWQGLLFAVTGNGVGASHKPPLAEAPSFIAVDAKTGKLVWQDNTPGQNVLHGQWGSPTVVNNGSGSPQIIFPGGDGWLYSFDPRGMKEGKGELLWKYDCNPKESVWKLGGRGTRNNLPHGPTLLGNHCYIATGQDPEHGGGQGRLSCIDIQGKGDVSPLLVFNPRAPATALPHRREQACVMGDGDFTRANPNSQEIWRFEQQDLNANGMIENVEKMSRSLSAITIQDDLLFVTDVAGVLHCIDRSSGQQHWGYHTQSYVYSTPKIVGDHVYLGTADGEVLVFGCSAEFSVAAPHGKPIQRIECGSSVNASVVADEDVLYFTTRNELIAVKNGALPK